MKSTAAALLLLLFSSPAFSFQLSGETGVYTVNLKGDYVRETGLEKWKGRKSGYYYRIELGRSFTLSRGTEFKFSITTGTTKVPYVNLFTSDKDSLFSGGVKTFNVKELYLRKRGFLFKNLTLKAGKQLFEVPGLFKDYLWGGSFTYSAGDFKLFWNQIAGYEGRYLLERRSSEDDVDIAVLGFGYRWVSAGVYRIMDAKGVENAEFKSGLFLKIKGSKGSVSLVSQNGRTGGWGELRLSPLTLKAGYWQKGITTYGYAEDLKSEGLIFRPSISGLRFGKVSLSFSLLDVPVTLYGARFETSSGKLIGNEAGGEVDYPFYGGALFLRGSAGTGGAYALFAGYRWGVKVPESYGSFGLKLKNYFSTSGEYADFPKKPYTPQLEYEGWSEFGHVGYWHSTYKLTAYSEKFRFKVSTGKNTKLDYIVWGNTADNFLYQRGHGKLWHFEELSLSERGFTAGLQPVSVEPLFSDYLPGISYATGGFRAGVFYNRFNGGRGSDDHAVALLSFKGLSYVAVSNGSSFRSALSFYKDAGVITVGALKEWGYGHSGDWGAVVGVKGELLKTALSVSYRVFSNSVSTFNLREFYRDVGLALRPGERGVRYLTASALRPLNVLGLSRFKTELRLLYNRLYSFSGRFLVQEFGMGILLKPGRRCSLELSGALGSSSLSYTGLKFSLSW